MAIFTYWVNALAPSLVRHCQVFPCRGVIHCDESVMGLKLVRHHFADAILIVFKAQNILNTRSSYTLIILTFKDYVP